MVVVARRQAALSGLAGQLIGRAERHHHRRHVVAGIAIGDIAADGADIADLRIGDLQRGFPEDRHLLREQRRFDDVALAVHGADDDVAAVGLDAAEIADRGEVDEMRRRRQAELHQRNKAVPAGERAGILAEIGEKADGVADGFRAVVGECAWDHGFLPGHARRSGLRPMAPKPILVDVGS